MPIRKEGEATEMFLRVSAARRLRSSRDEGGFTLVETMFAITVIFASLTALAFVVTNGFRYIAHSRERVQATAFANQVLESLRGLSYADVQAGMKTSDLTGDTKIVSCTGTYRFESCSGAKIVHSTLTAGYTQPYLVPHQGTSTIGGIQLSWKTYVTNDDPTTNPYTLTAIVSWSGGSIPGNDDNTVRVQTRVWSPDGCVSSDTHPYSAPCSPFFSGLALVPDARFTISGSLHGGVVDFSEARISLVSTEASAQQEQISNLVGSMNGARIEVDSSSGTTTIGDARVVVDADSDPGSPAATVNGGSLPASGSSHNVYQPDCCNEAGIELTIGSGDTGTTGLSTAASSADANACPPSGTRETDALPCSGSQVKQGGTITAVLPNSHFVSTLGDSYLLRITAPTPVSRATVERDAVTNYDGLMDVVASRTLGSIFIGGFPTAGMTAPTGMSTSSTNNGNYCVRLTGLAETATLKAGERTSTAPANTLAGSFFYYNGTGFSSKTVTDATMNSLSVTCTKTQVVSGANVTWEVTVAAGGAVAGSLPAAVVTTDPSDSQTRLEAKVWTVPMNVTVNYKLIVNGVTEYDVNVATNLGSVLAKGVYGPPPAAG